MDYIYSALVAAWGVFSIVLMGWGALALIGVAAQRLVSKEDRYRNNLTLALNALRNKGHWEIDDIFEDLADYDMYIFEPGALNESLDDTRVRVYVDGRCFGIAMKNEDADAIKQYLDDSAIIQQRLVQQKKKRGEKA